MATTHGKAQVAVLNTSDDILEMLQKTFEQEGITAVTAHVDDVKRGRLDLVEFLARHDPAVVLYDIPPPYEENWRFLRLVRDTEVAKGRTFIIMTTNKAQLERLVGPTEAYEIVGKPFDIDALLEAVKGVLDPRRGG